MRARDCPEFVHRLKVLACMDIAPDPIPAIEELATRANQSENAAIWKLNLDHVRRIISTEHKRFWDAAAQAYFEINGASPTRIEQLTTNVAVLKSAVQSYQEISSKWTVDGSARLFPNMVNPLPEEKGKIEYRVAQIPELPEDPYGGEYLIIEIDGKPELVGSGISLLERQEVLAPINAALVEYSKDHDGACPEDLDLFSKEYGASLPVADGFGYPLLLDYEKCQFYFEPVSEENPPILSPYGVEVEVPTEIDLTPMEESDDASSADPVIEEGTPESGG
jgi:hypothetical protein